MSLLSKIQALGKAIKESGEASLFSVLGNHNITEAFKLNPGHFFLFPFIALGMSINWVIETIQYARARNKSWFNTSVYIALTAITGLALTSIIGTVILGEFIIGPFLFVGALSTGVALQIGLFFKNLFHALRSPKGSSQRMAFFQEMGKNTFNAILMGVTLALVVAAMISPAGPVILAALGATAATLTVVSLVWHFMPKTWKQTIKRFFGFNKTSYEGKSEIEELKTLSKAQQPVVESAETADQPLLPESSQVKDFNLFKQERRKLEVARVAEQSPSAARKMLEDSIKSHIQRLAPSSPHHNFMGVRLPDNMLYTAEDKKIYESRQAYLNGAKPISDALNKQGQKIEVLQILLDALNNMFEPGSELNVKQHTVMLPSISELHKAHPKAFQSFFSSTSNTESLYDSVKFFIENYKSNLEEELESSSHLAASNQ